MLQTRLYVNYSGQYDLLGFLHFASFGLPRLCIFSLLCCALIHLNWQHGLFKNPKPSPDIKTLFTHHSCAPLLLACLYSVYFISLLCADIHVCLYSLNWQHQLCKNPKPSPDIKTLFTDHSCAPANGARAPPSGSSPLVGPMAIPKTGAFPPIGIHSVSEFD